MLEELELVVPEEDNFEEGATLKKVSLFGKFGHELMQGTQVDNSLIKNVSIGG